MRISRKSCFFFILFVFLIDYFFWVYHVQPFPDKDAVLQLYFPFLNYLQGSLWLGNDYSYLSAAFFENDYPKGGAWLARLISTIGLQNLFLSEFYLLSIFLLVALAGVCFVLPRSNNLWFLPLLLFFLPGTQCLLKGLSPHGFCVLFSFLGTLGFMAYLASRRKTFFAVALFCFWVSMVFKHMGVFHYFSFYLAYLLLQIFSKPRSRLENLVLLVLPFLALLLYPLDHLQGYLQTTFSHTPFLSAKVFWLAFPILAFGLFFLYFLERSKRREQIPPKIFSHSLWIYLVLGASFYLFVDPPGEDSALRNAVLVLIIGYAGLIFYLLRYRISKVRGFFLLVVILTLTHNSALYVSWMARSSYLFFLPHLLLTTLVVFQNRSKFQTVLLFFVLLFLTNRFPDLNTLERSPALNPLSSIYFEGFKAIHQNPLGWGRSKIRALRSSLVEILDDYDFGPEPPWTLIRGLHFHSRLALTFPRHILNLAPQWIPLDSLSKEQAMKFLEQFNGQDEGLFQAWVETGKVPVILQGSDPFTTRRSQFMTIKQISESKNPNHVLQALESGFWAYLNQNKSLLDAYELRPVIRGAHPLNLYIHKSIKKVSPEFFQSVKTRFLRQYKNRFSFSKIESSETSPSELSETERRTKRAGELFLESNQSFESDPQKSIDLLKEVLKLDPTHKEARKDLGILLKSRNQR